MTEVKTVRDSHINAALKKLNAANKVTYPMVGYSYYADIKGDGSNNPRINTIINPGGGVTRSHMNGATKRDTVARIDAERLAVVGAEIRQAMAKAFFASAWADQCDDSGQSGLISGREIMDVMPITIDPAAEHAAKTLELGLLEKNKGFSCLAGLLDWLQTVPTADGDKERSAEMLGHYLAMQAMGHGVGLFDAFGDQTYEFFTVPHVEFGSHSLEKDYFYAPSSGAGPGDPRSIECAHGKGFNCRACYPNQTA